MSEPPVFPGLQGPPTPEKIEQAIVALISMSRMLLGDDRTRAAISRAMGDRPKVELGP